MSTEIRHPDHPLPRVLAYSALFLNVFVFVVVNFCIYWARWRWIEADPTGRPPTISLAISSSDIGPVFAIWVSVSAVCLVFGVWLLIWHYLGLLKRCLAPKRSLTNTIVVSAILVAVAQPVSALGMHWLSTFRLPFAAELHMTGSYMFFVAQAFVVLIFSIVNMMLLNDVDSLSEMEVKGLVTRRWVKIRLVTGVISVILALAYLGLFFAKDHFVYPEYPLVYRAYVSVEPMVITSFLLVLVMCHADMFRRRA